MAEAVRMNKIRKVVDGLKPTALMVVVAAAFAAANVLYKLAEIDGMSFGVMNAYRFIFATIFMVPLALVYDRKNKPKFTRKVFLMTFLCGLFGGSLLQNLYLESLSLTSATYVSATFNLIPAITFILAILFRLEKLNLGTASGKTKVLGTIIGIGGTMVMTFYKGVQIKIWAPHSIKIKGHIEHQNETLGRQLLGVASAFGSCFSYALWLIIQGLMSKDSKEYPSHHSSTALMCIMAALQSVAFALCVERDWSQWKLGWDVRLLSVAFSGIVASGAMVIATAWCVEKRGPLFVSSFSPLMLVLVVIAASLTLAEKLYLGSVIGAVLIVCGLYMVLWGKKREPKGKAQHQQAMSMSSSHIAPSEVLDRVVNEDKSDQNQININLTPYVAKDDKISPMSGNEGHDDISDAKDGEGSSGLLSTNGNV